MISNMVALTPQEQLLQNIKDCDIQFFLTGSRYFNAHSPDSDWDFFCLNSEKAEKWLESQMFTRRSKRGYADSNTISIYHNAECNIDVQLVRDARLKEKAQAILSLPAFRNLLIDAPKHLARQVWDDALKAAAI